MRPNPAEFDRLYRDGALRIALIGMSNVGKTHWARTLKQRYGFVHYEVDERIQEILSLSSIANTAHWMGGPEDQAYEKNASRYLKLEAEHTLAAEEIPGNLILDTTGSVIHLAEEIKRNIKNKYLIVYLRASKADSARLIKHFTVSPKPLIWDIYYQKSNGESETETIAKCYPKLLSARHRLYSYLADLTLPAGSFSKTHEWLDIIRAALD